MKSNVFICPPCGESVAQARKEGQNKNKTLWPPLPRLTSVLPPQGREMSFGFTLIELLVVVLIIGILAAEAVPQYQKAVLKARMMQAVVTGKAYLEAQNVYYLANGSFAMDFDSLDISLQAPAGWTMQAAANTEGLDIRHSSSGIYFNFWPAHSINDEYKVNTAFCIISASAPMVATARQVCQSMSVGENWYSSQTDRYLYRIM